MVMAHPRHNKKGGKRKREAETMRPAVRWHGLRRGGYDLHVQRSSSVHREQRKIKGEGSAPMHLGDVFLDQERSKRSKDSPASNMGGGELWSAKHFSIEKSKVTELEIGYYEWLKTEWENHGRRRDDVRRLLH